MKITQSLQSLSLASLKSMFAAGTENLLESKREKSHDMTLAYQRVLDKIQLEIVSKRAELPPMK